VGNGLPFLAHSLLGHGFGTVYDISTIFILWFGTGLLPKILICALIVVFPTLVTWMIGVRAIEPDLIGVADIAGANRWQILRYVDPDLMAARDLAEPAEDVVDERIDRVEGYRTGLWMRYLWGDIAATAATVRERARPGVMPPGQALLDFWAFFLVPVKYDYLDWHDLLPMWSAIVGRGRGGVTRLRNALSKK